MFRRIVLACSTVLMFNSLVAHGDEVNVNLSNDAFNANYLVDMGQGMLVGGGVLHEEDNGQIVNLDVLVRDDLRSGEHDFSAGVGGKLMAVLPDGGEDAVALTLGGFVNYKLPNIQAVALNSEVYYAPSVTSTSDIDGIFYFTASVELEVIERAKLHAGYRKVRVRFPGGSGDMDKGIHAGIKLEF